LLVRVNLNETTLGGGRGLLGQRRHLEGDSRTHLVWSNLRFSAWLVYILIILRFESLVILVENVGLGQTVEVGVPDLNSLRQVVSAALSLDAGLETRGAVLLLDLGLGQLLQVGNLVQVRPTLCFLRNFLLVLLC